MAKLSLLAAGLIVTSLVTIAAHGLSAEEKSGDEKVTVPVVKTEHPKEVKATAEAKNKEEVKPKEEAANAMAEGTKGVTEGVIARNEKGYLILKTNDGNILFRACPRSEKWLKNQ